MQVVAINGIEYDLTAIEKDCWVQMLNGSLQYKNPFHNPVVGNNSVHGINLRTVVLRKVDTINKQLCIHTDIRSGKWNELQTDNKITWLFYSQAARLQIRISGKATLHSNDAIANDAWAKSTISSRKVYCGIDGPSTISPIPCSGLSSYLDNNDPTVAESEAGRKNFGIINTQVQWMEWLWLNSKGHRRASFTYDTANNFNAQWLVP
jgi:pyridoxamine 5'-phosphate oxidase